MILLKRDLLWQFQALAISSVLALYFTLYYYLLPRVSCLPPEVNKCDDGHIRFHILTSNRALNMISLWPPLIIWERKQVQKSFTLFPLFFSHIKFDVIICLNSMISGGGENCGWLIGVGSNTKVIGCDCKSLFILQLRSLFFIIIKLGYNTYCHWLKEHALWEYRA